MKKKKLLKLLYKVIRVIKMTRDMKDIKNIREWFKINYWKFPVEKAYIPSLHDPSCTCMS